MEQHSERFGPRSGHEAQIPAPGEAGEAEAWDLEDEAAVVAWDEHEDADPVASDAADDAGVEAWEEDGPDAAWSTEAEPAAAMWDVGEDPDAVAWDADHEPDAGQGPDEAEWQAGGTAGDAIAVPGAPRPRAATGEARVDAALARLGELNGRPVMEHRAIFEDVHRRLRDVLGELDSREPDQVPAAGAERRAGR